MQALKRKKLKQFLSTLDEYEQVLAMLDPEGFIDTTLKNMENC